MLQIRLPTYSHCRINRDRDRERCSAPAELKKGTRDQGEETMKDRSPAGRESKSILTDWSWDKCVR